MMFAGVVLKIAAVQTEVLPSLSGMIEWYKVASSD